MTKNLILFFIITLIINLNLNILDQTKLFCGNGSSCLGQKQKNKSKILFSKKELLDTFNEYILFSSYDITPIITENSTYYKFKPKNFQNQKMLKKYLDININTIQENNLNIELDLRDIDIKEEFLNLIYNQLAKYILILHVSDLTFPKKQLFLNENNDTIFKNLLILNLYDSKILPEDISLFLNKSPNIEKFNYNNCCNLNTENLKNLLKVR